MILLTLKEANDATTRLNIDVDAIAFRMATFFKDVIGLSVEVEHSDLPTLIDEQETARAELYMKEWRNFGNPLVAVK